MNPETKPADAATRPEQALRDLTSLIGGHSPKAISGVFQKMAIAEDAIDAAKPRLTKAQGSAAFLAMVPPPLLALKTDALFRSHCDELVNRARYVGLPDKVREGHVKQGRTLDLALPTSAEMLVVLSEQSLRAPLTPEGAALMERLFEDVFGEQTLATIAGHPAREPWTNQATEAREALRRTMGPQPCRKDVSR